MPVEWTSVRFQQGKETRTIPVQREGTGAYVHTGSRQTGRGAAGASTKAVSAMRHSRTRLVLCAVSIALVGPLGAAPDQSSVGSGLKGMTPDAQSATTSRRQTLDELLLMLQPSRTPANGRINAHDRTWEDWLRRTGELPPDFDAMPSIPDLPDPLVLREDGRSDSRDDAGAVGATKSCAPVASVEHWIFGRMPPAPDNLRATVTATHARRRRDGPRSPAGVRAGPSRDAADRAGDPGRQGPVPRLPHEPRAQPALDLHGRAARLHRGDLSRHGSELRQRRRLRRVDRDLSRIRLVVPGAMGVGRLAHGRLPHHAAGGGQARRSAWPGTRATGSRRCWRRRSTSASAPSSRRAATAASSTRGATPPSRSSTRASSCWRACSRTGSTRG